MLKSFRSFSESSKTREGDLKNRICVALILQLLKLSKLLIQESLHTPAPKAHHQNHKKKPHTKKTHNRSHLRDQEREGGRENGRGSKMESLYKKEINVLDRHGISIQQHGGASLTNYPH